MQFVFKYPVYAFVASSATDSSGTTSFTNPLTITCSATGDKPASIEAIPIFTDEVQATAFKQATKAPHAFQLRMLTHEHLIDFLTKASSRAKHLAIDPPLTAFTAERIWPIDDFVGELRKLVAKRQPA